MDNPRAVCKAARAVLRRSVVFLALGIVGCAPDVGAVQAPIANGSLEPGEDAVVLVEAFSGVGICTGTLISDRVVLTAKHCVQAPGEDRPYPASTITVGVGPAMGSTAGVRGWRVWTTPGTYTSDPRFGIGGALIGIDVGVLTLLEPIEGVTPIPLGRDDAATLIGQPFTAIGYGMTETGLSGVKYRTTGQITNVDEGVIFSQMVICEGDSGGPLILESPERRVVGVASFGEAGACPSRQDGYNRIDIHLGVIDSALLSTGGCPFVSEEACNSVDDDCDGTVDEGCLAQGQPCSRDDECAFAQLPPRFEPLSRPAFCGATPAGTICTRSCDATRPTTDCAAIDVPFLEVQEAVDGSFCVVNDGCGGLCVPGAAGGGGIGEPCTTATDCASLYCADTGSGSRCQSPCEVGASGCASDEVCSAAGSCGACVPPSGPGRAAGEPCGADTDCAAGACVADGSLRYCAPECGVDDNCPEGFHCRDGRCATGARSITGQRCAVTGDCLEGDMCSPDRFCDHPCSTDGSCPEGFTCAEGGVGCLPGGGLLGDRCTDDASCLQGTCAEVRGASICSQPCGSAGTCPASLSCVRDGSELFCASVLPSDDDGGCSVSRRAAPTSVPVALGLSAIVALFRRRFVGRGAERVNRASRAARR